MIKVVIADDQKLLSQSLKTIIENDPDIVVAACVGNGLKALEFCQNEKVDLVLMDIKMPVCDGIEGTRLIKEKYPGIKVLILTTFEDDQKVYEALKNGADGYILKDITPEELTQAVKNTFRGFGIFSKNPFSSVIKNVNVVDFEEDEEDDFIEEKTSNETLGGTKLKKREIEIIKMISNGMGNKEIAESLCLSLGRTKNIISALLSKLGYNDRSQLVSLAYKNNWVSKEKV